MVRVLVLDDDQAFLDLMRTWLPSEGIDVSAGSDPTWAIDTLRREQPDVVIVDLWLPQPNGASFIEQVRSDPQIAPTPIIVCTAAVDWVRQQPGVLALIDALLAKPFDVEECLDLIGRMAPLKGTPWPRPTPPGAEPAIQPP